MKHETNDPRGLFDAIERSMERRAEAGAAEFLRSLSRTRGMWILPHLGGAMALYVTVGVFVGVTLQLTNWIPHVIGIPVAIGWWSAAVTKRHPFWSFVIGGIVVPVLLLGAAR